MSLPPPCEQPRQDTHRRGHAVGILVFVIVLIAAVLFFLFKSTESSEFSKRLEQAKIDASALLARANKIEEAVLRYGGLAPYVDSSLTLQDLIDEKLLKPGFSEPIRFYAESQWEFVDMPFSVLNYKAPGHLMLVARNMPLPVCKQINVTLFRASDIVTITSAAGNGLEIGLTEQQLSLYGGTNAGCFNYNPESGTYEENVFVMFVRTLQF